MCPNLMNSGLPLEDLACMSEFKAFQGLSESSHLTDMLVIRFVVLSAALVCTDRFGIFLITERANMHEAYTHPFPELQHALLASTMVATAAGRL